MPNANLKSEKFCCQSTLLLSCLRKLFVLVLVLLMHLCAARPAPASEAKRVAVIGLHSKNNSKEERSAASAVVRKLIETLFLDENFVPVRDEKRITRAKEAVKYDFSSKLSLKIGETLGLDYVISGDVEIKKGEIYINATTFSIAKRAPVFHKNIFCVDTSLIPQVVKRYVRELDEKIFWSELVIKTEPPGAEIYIEGKFMGVTPFRRHIKPYTYSIKLLKDGFRKKRDVITILRGEKILKSYTLSRIVYVLSTPSGAKVYIDDKLWGTTPTSYYSESDILNISWKKSGYGTVRKVTDISYMKGKRRISANLIKLESIRFFDLGIKKEEKFSEIFKEFLASKTRKDSSILSSFMFGRVADLFKEGSYFFQSAIMVDPNNGIAYLHLSQIYYKYILFKLGSPLYLKSEVSELIDLATQTARIAINLETDNRTTLQAINILGSIMLQHSKNRSDTAEGVQDINSAMGQFEKGIRLFDDIAEHDSDLANSISIYDNLHFNLSLCIEEVYHIKKAAKSEDAKLWCQKAIKSWDSYDYLSVINPDNPFKPTPNPLGGMVKKHIQDLKLACSN